MWRYKLNEVCDNNNEESNFVNKLIENIKEINTTCIHNKIVLDQIVQEFASTIGKIWYKYLKIVNITKHSKECLEQYWQSRYINEWKKFRNIVKKTKYKFFDLRIQEIKEITNKSREPWELMNWVRPCKLPAIKVIQFNRRPYIEIDDLWQALHLSFNSTQDHQTDPQLLKEIPCKEVTNWNLFSKEEFISAIEKNYPGDILR